MKKVLIITYYWPPASSPGVQRWLKFVKYLKQYKIQPIVLTASNASVPNIDMTLLDDVPADVKVTETKSLEPILIYNLLRGKASRKVEVGMGELKETKSPIKKLAKYLRSNIFIPDAKIGWYYNVRNKALKITKSEQVDTIITTGPPHTTHLIGNYIKQNTEVKWIADFRDPWTGLFYEKYLSRSERAQRKNKRLEQMVLQNCDSVITVSNGMKAEFSEVSDKITVIPNGFDEDDLPLRTQNRSEKFYLTYTGNLKVNQNIKSLWTALAEICEDEDFRSNFVLHFVGNINAEVLADIYSFGLEDIVETYPFVKHSEAVALMMKTNLLWLPIPVSKGNKLIITGKIFEYLASRTPILSIGPVDGDAAKILTECDRDSMISYDDLVGIKQSIVAHYNSWKKNDGLSIKHEGDAHMKYSRRILTAQVAEIIHQN